MYNLYRYSNYNAIENIYSCYHSHVVDIVLLLLLVRFSIMMGLTSRGNILPTLYPRPLNLAHGYCLAARHQVSQSSHHRSQYTTVDQNGKPGKEETQTATPHCSL